MIIELPSSNLPIATRLFTQAWADRAYIDAFFSNIHWQTVEQRLSLPARAYKATG